MMSTRMPEILPPFVYYKCSYVLCNTCQSRCQSHLKSLKMIPSAVRLFRDFSAFLLT